MGRFGSPSFLLPFFFALSLRIVRNRGSRWGGHEGGYISGRGAAGWSWAAGHPDVGRHGAGRGRGGSMRGGQGDGVIGWSLQLTQFSGLCSLMLTMHFRMGELAGPTFSSCSPSVAQELSDTLNSEAAKNIEAFLDTSLKARRGEGKACPHFAHSPSRTHFQIVCDHLRPLSSPNPDFVPPPPGHQERPDLHPADSHQLPGQPTVPHHPDPAQCGQQPQTAQRKGRGHLVHCHQVRGGRGERMGAGTGNLQVRGGKGAVKEVDSL